MKATSNKTVLKLARLITPVALAAMFTTGCQTYEHQNKVIAFYNQGNLTNAVAEANKQAEENAKNKDAIIWRLEQAAVLRANGQFEDSNKAFDLAQKKIDDYAQKAKVRVAQEAGALLSNQAELDYEGRSYDGIMLNTYKALNFLCLNQTDRARQELIRAYQRQQDAVEENKRRIEKTQAEAEKAKDKEKAAMEKAEKDPKFQTQLQNCMTNINELKVYADYVNPFSVYLDGLYFMCNAADNSDLERARKSLERTASFAEGNDYVKEDLATVENLLSTNVRPLAPTTYVIFETGCAPIRDQIRVDIPIIISKVSYVGAAFPTLKPQGNYQPALSVAANGTNYSTKTVANMDSIVALDYKNDLPVVITKTIAATVIKAVAAYAANEAARQGGGDMAGLFMQITTAVYQMAVNIADTRTWTTLPKEFQVCRFPTPADGKIELSTPNGMKASVALNTAVNGTKIDLTSAGTQATLAPAPGVNVVYVKSINAAVPLIINQFKLK